MTPGPGSVTVALAGSVEQEVTLTVGGGQGHCLGLGGAAAVVPTGVVAGVAGAGVAGGHIAGATDRAPSVGWRPGNQTVHKAGNVLELVTNSARYRLTQVAAVVICWRLETTAVASAVPLVSQGPGQQQEEEKQEVVKRLGMTSGHLSHRTRT